MESSGEKDAKNCCTEFSGVPAYTPELRSPALYGAAAADFEPQPGRDNGWLIAHFSRLADPLIDRVFTLGGDPLANDLVVPTDSVFATNGHPSFPIDDPLLYDVADGIWHTAFFAEARTIAHIDAHLDRVQQAALARRPSFRRGTRGGTRGGTLGATTRAYPANEVAPWRRAAAGHDDTLTRDPQLDFCARLEAGASADLVVRLELPASEAAPAGRMTLAFAAGSDEIELVAEVSAPGFRVDGPRHTPLYLLRERDPKLERATFRLTALDAGSEPLERMIVVSFFRGNDCVGGITHYTVVVPHGYSEPTQNSAGRSDVLRVSLQPREAADLVVCLRRPQTGRDVFELSLRSQITGEEYEARGFGSLDLDGKELATYLTDALDPSFACFPGDDLADADYDAALAAWNLHFLARLAELGKQLWLHLPQPFRTEYLRLMGLANPPRSLFIFSDELSFPWEIVRPSGIINGDYCELPPLGVAHLLGRWRPGIGARPQPQALPVTRMAIVVPGAEHSALPWAADEVRQLHALLPFAQRVAPATLQQVGRLLSDGDAQIVHFSGHGEAGANADLAALELEGGESITAMAFAANRLGSTRQPLLFLNACTVGRGGRVLGRSGGLRATASKPAGAASSRLTGQCSIRAPRRSGWLSTASSRPGGASAKRSASCAARRATTQRHWLTRTLVIRLRGCCSESPTDDPERIAGRMPFRVPVGQHIGDSRIARVISSPVGPPATIPGSTRPSPPACRDLGRAGTRR
jgi:hypothetical protein